MDAVLADAEISKRLADLSLKPANFSPTEFAQFLQREHDKYAAVVKAANIKAE
jgi:tripartite-type tricarboxylate transporter receptor subunit TctC